jgi:hypothetical protein
MPYLLILLGIAAVGAGVVGYKTYEKQKELEWKKSYAECVKTLVDKYKMKPAEATHYCKLEDIKLDLVNIALLGATVSTTLIALKILLGGEKCNNNYNKMRPQTKSKV